MSQAALPASHTLNDRQYFRIWGDSGDDGTYDAAFERLRREVCKVADLECLHALSYSCRALEECDLNEVTQTVSDVEHGKEDEHTRETHAIRTLEPDRMKRR